MAGKVGRMGGAGVTRYASHSEDSGSNLTRQKSASQPVIKLQIWNTNSTASADSDYD